MNRGVLIGIVAAVLLLCCCVGGGIATFGLGGAGLFAAISGPNNTLNAYYDAVKAEDWPKAYAQLSPDLQSQITQAQLRQAFTDAAARDGKIVKVSISNTQVDNNEATIDAELEREKSKGKVKASLVKIGNDWKIDEFLTP